MVMVGEGKLRSKDKSKGRLHCEDGKELVGKVEREHAMKGISGSPIRILARFNCHSGPHQGWSCWAGLFVSLVSSDNH